MYFVSDLHRPDVTTTGTPPLVDTTLDGYLSQLQILGVRSQDRISLFFTLNRLWDLLESSPVPRGLLLDRTGCGTYVLTL